jgi:hypothetical protein
VKFTEVAEATELSGRSNFTTMAPPKQEEPRKTARQPRVRTRAQTQSQGSEQQQPPEVINVDEIPSPDTTPGSPTLMVEETQQTTPVGMDIDRPEEGQGRQNEDASSQVQPENPEEAPESQWDDSKSGRSRPSQRSHRQPCQNTHRREQWKMS